MLHSLRLAFTRASWDPHRIHQAKSSLLNCLFYLLVCFVSFEIWRLVCCKLCALRRGVVAFEPIAYNFSVNMADSLLLSAYEIARQKMIQDNQAALESMGLGPSSQLATTSDADAPEAGADTKTKARKTKTKKTKTACTKKKMAGAKRKPAAPVRRSTRLRGGVRQTRWQRPCFRVCLVVQVPFRGL